MKNIMIVVIVLLLIIAGLVYYKNNSAQKNNTSSSGMKTTAAPEKSMFTSIQDALSKSLSLKCQYAGENNLAVTSYIKAGAIRSETYEGATMKSGSIIKDKKMYMWDPTKKTGFLMDLSTITPPPTAAVSPTAKTNDQSQNYQNAMSQLEKYKNSCKPAVVADSLFVPPSDIEFTDFSSMMKGMMQPTGAMTTTGAPAMNPTDIEKYKEMMNK